MRTIEVIKRYSEDIFQDIYKVLRRIEEKENLDFVGCKQYVKEQLEDPRNSNVILREDGEPIGFMFSIPHDVACEDLIEDDPLMKKDSQRYYICAIGILPEYSGGRGFLQMAIEMLEDLKQRFEINKVSMHARKTNGLSRVIQEVFRGMLTEVRPIEKWKYGNNEPYDYIEGTYIK